MDTPSSQQQKIPRHVALIMDGNGRWAAARGLDRIEGHKAGADAAQRVVEAARDAGVSFVTLFGFSSENWNRPPSEIEGLMNLLRLYLRRETADMHKSGAKLKVIGDRARLPTDIVGLIEQAEEVTRNNTKITVIIALSYGGRQDILFAAREAARRAQAGELNLDTLDEQAFSGLLMTGGIPDPDLVIRTGGESRVSNFLMWQMAYSEMLFSDKFWPDFTRADMEDALRFYAGRDRRFGGLSARSVAG